MEEPVDITPYLDQLDESLRDKVLQLQKGRCAPLPSSPWEAQPQASFCSLGGAGRMEREQRPRAVPSAVWGVRAAQGQPQSSARGSHPVPSEDMSL